MTCSSTFLKYPQQFSLKLLAREYLVGFYLRDLSRKYVVKFFDDFYSFRGFFLGSFAISFKIGENAKSHTRGIEYQ